MEENSKADKTGKFVSANSDIGATRRFKLLKNFLFVMLSVKKSREKIFHYFTYILDRHQDEICCFWFSM
ncbi:CLUMA_CG016775, isoform A [Clunio marinus]|uniref:CLUMA_CG016775, isoform A n=1 Tax=Clunio marinus TaxID=568069 RepID=A0A1J1IU83_9DIPT|nr:CLUMA_CG016775, isoform A [Clunio marinus]